jgi:hypothetical protein
MGITEWRLRVVDLVVVVGVVVSLDDWCVWDPRHRVAVAVVVVGWSDEFSCSHSCGGRWLIGACGILGIGLQLQSSVDRTNLVVVILVVVIGWLVRVGSSASRCSCISWLQPEGMHRWFYERLLLKYFRPIETRHSPARARSSFGNVDEIFPSQLHHPRSNNGVISLRDFGPQWPNFICCFLQFTNSEVNSSIKIESTLN